MPTQIKFTVERWKKEANRGDIIAEHITGVLFPRAKIFNSDDKTDMQKVTVASCYYQPETLPVGDRAGNVSRWQLGPTNDWRMRLDGDEITLSYRYNMPDEVAEGLKKFLQWQLK